MAVRDNMTKEQRSYTMSRIRSRGNASTERAFIALLRRSGIKGWRRGVKLLGKPDFVFHAERVAVFIDGCFWHGCPRCQLGSRSNTDYWSAKIAGNTRRDAKVKRELRASRWRVVRVWEHTLKRSPQSAVRQLLKALNAGASEQRARSD